MPRYARETEGRCGLRFELAASVREQIYANAVFPAQGTRPLLSSLHAILVSADSDDNICTDVEASNAAIEVLCCRPSTNTPRGGSTHIAARCWRWWTS